MADFRILETEALEDLHRGHPLLDRKAVDFLDAYASEVETVPLGGTEYLLEVHPIIKPMKLVEIVWPTFVRGKRVRILTDEARMLAFALLRAAREAEAGRLPEEPMTDDEKEYPW